MNERSDERELYDTLDVSESATTEEIQQAYFRLVRLCSPRLDPERYQALNHAREILVDVRRRGEYDQTRKNGPRVRVLVDQAARTLERDPQKAMGLLKSAVTIAPDLPRPRLLLAQLLMRNKDFALAERQYLWLLRRTPNDEQVRCKLARCLMMQGKAEEAESQLKTILSLNEAHYDAQLLLARIYRHQGRTTELIDALEQAIFMDEVENFADFNALVQLLLVYIQNEDAVGVEETAQRLICVIPAERATLCADAFLQTAESLFREDHFDWSRQLLLSLQGLPLPEDAPQRVRFTEQIHKSELHAEAANLERDTLLQGALRDCLQVVYRDRSSDTIRQARMSNAFSALQKEYELDPRQLLQHLAYLRNEYPLISANQEEFLGTLCQRALQRQTILQSQRAAKATAAQPTPAPSPQAPRRHGFFDRLVGTR
jgi:tetratricopeptide (TPR) repeat protein